MDTDKTPRWGRRAGWIVLGVVLMLSTMCGSVLGALGALIITKG